jgi:hypothetical protein
MTKAEKIAKLKAAGLDDEAIAAIMDGDDSSGEIATLKAQIAAAEAKANGINGDKKKYQQRADELQAKLDELEGKDLGEAGKLKLENERMKSRLEATEKAKSDLESTYKTEKRSAEMARIAQKLKFLDTVPEDTRQLLVSTELKDLEDLGNTVLVDERLKAVSQKYSGLLAAQVATGAGTKAGNVSQAGNRPNLEALKTKPLAEIAKDPKAYVREFTAAVEADK